MREVEDYEDDDLLSQSQQSKHDILSMLEKREKDKEEVELEECFRELKEKSGNEERIEELANESINDFKERAEIENLYHQPSG
jgi:hypothetical protein